VRSSITPENMALPNGGAEAFETADPDEAEFRMSRLVAPHKLAPLHSRQIALKQIGIQSGALNLFQISYGTEVRIEADGCPPYYLVKMPISGSAHVRSHREQVATGQFAAAFLNPDRPLTFDYGADCSSLVAAIEGGALEKRCAELLEMPNLSSPLDFRLGLDLNSIPGQQLLRLVAYLRDEALLGGALHPGTPSLMLPPLQQMILTTLLTVQPHAFSEKLQRPASRIAPGSVVRAEAFIEANAHEPLTPAEIAAAAGASERALFRAFQDFRGETPMARLRAVRLERVHKELLVGEPDTTSVSTVAMDWGFHHLGHFGQAYRRRFGETPVETLRRWR
jgi:AraC-like DNA-binding protein